MSKHLRTDLQKLEKHLLHLAARVEENVRKAVAALLARDIELAQAVIQSDDEIDRMEVELEEECLKMLALHQPVATDLRFITVCLKIDSDLERIGDLACNIAERALSLSQQEPLPAPELLESMMESSTRTVRRSLDAFVQGDSRTARAVCAADDEVDRYNRTVIAELMTMMNENPETLERGVQLFSVSKSLERIADHATNIAEDVVYMVEGEIIRHQGRSEDATPPNGRPFSDR